MAYPRPFGKKYPEHRSVPPARNRRQAFREFLLAFFDPIPKLNKVISLHSTHTHTIDNYCAKHFGSENICSAKQIAISRMNLEKFPDCPDFHPCNGLTLRPFVCITYPWHAIYCTSVVLVVGIMHVRICSVSTCICHWHLAQWNFLVPRCHRRVADVDAKQISFKTISIRNTCVNLSEKPSYYVPFGYRRFHNVLSVRARQMQAGCCWTVCGGSVRQS